MSSSGSKGNGLNHASPNGGQNIMIMSGTEPSVSEAISNISSPDYQDEHDLLSTRDLSAAMAISDPSDSDSTLIVDQVKKSKKKEREPPNRLAIANISVDLVLKDSEDELATNTSESSNRESFGIAGNNQYQQQFEYLGDHRGASPLEDDCSDVESLHSFHYSPKAVDMPSAVRLAKRLYTLDGFKKSDVSRHLSKK